jgi:hypothetical protein
MRENPGVTSADPELRSLLAADREALQQVAATTEALNQASTALVNGASFETTLRVVDPPRQPIGPSTGKKHLLKLLIAGLFAGSLISIFGIVLLTKAQQPGHPAEITPMGDEPMGEAPIASNGDQATVDEHGPAQVEAPKKKPRPRAESKRE